jgi:hypothetical protein
MSSNSPLSVRDGDFHSRDVVAWCEFPSLIRAAFQAQFDRFPHITERFLPRAALADTARDHRALRDDVSVLARVEDDWQFHIRRAYHLRRLLARSASDSRKQYTGRSAEGLANSPIGVSSGNLLLLYRRLFSSSPQSGGWPLR